MVYECEDWTSFDSLDQVYKEFKENNTVGAYKMLISVVSQKV